MERHYYVKKLNAIKRKIYNILIVDDDKDTSEIFKSVLELRGHKVNTLHEGVSCISECKNNNYDIIFMDYHIPDIDGVQLADFIRDIYKSNSTLFAFTGDSSDNTLKQFKTIGITGALIKPIDTDLLDNILSAIENNGCIDKAFFSKLAKHSKGSLIMF